MNDSEDDAWYSLPVKERIGRLSESVISKSWTARYGIYTGTSSSGVLENDRHLFEIKSVGERIDDYVEMLDMEQMITISFVQDYMLKVDPIKKALFDLKESTAPYETKLDEVAKLVDNLPENTKQEFHTMMQVNEDLDETQTQAEERRPAETNKFRESDTEAVSGQDTQKDNTELLVEKAPQSKKRRKRVKKLIAFLVRLVGGGVAGGAAGFLVLGAFGIIPGAIAGALAGAGMEEFLTAIKAAIKNKNWSEFSMNLGPIQLEVKK